MISHDLFFRPQESVYSLAFRAYVALNKDFMYAHPTPTVLTEIIPIRKANCNSFNAVI